MRGWLVVLLIAAAAAGAAYYLLQEPEARGRSSRALGDGPRPSPGNASPGTQPKRPEGDAEEAAPKPRIVFEGKLVNEDKEPVTGAAVTVRGWENGRYETIHGKGTSDEQGRFSVEIEAVQWVQCEARHALYQKGETYFATNNDKPVEMILRRGAPVSLTVVDARGSAVADAKVTAWIEQVYEAQGWRWQDVLGKWSTDAQGRAALGAVAPGKLTVAVDHPSFAPANRELRVAGLDDVALEFRLDPGGAVEGHVTDSEGMPVAAARVSPVGDDKRVALTDGKGHYRLEAVAIDGVRIVAEADGYGPGWFGEQTGWGRAVPITVRSGETIQGIDIVLGSAAFVRGRIVDEAGKPVEGIGVSVSWSQRAIAFKSPTTDAEGRFVIGPYALKEDTGVVITLWFNSGEYILPKKKEVELWPGKDVDLGDIRAGSRATVRGRVLDVDGTPLIKGSVRGKGSLAVGVKPDGTFELKGLAGGKNTLAAFGPPKTRTRSQPLTVSLEQGGVLEDVELRLEPTFSITGRVVTPDGRPRQAGILAVAAGTASPYKWEVDLPYAYVSSQKDGTYELFMLLGGEYDVGIPEWTGDGGMAFRKKPGHVTVRAGSKGVEFVVPVEGGFIQGRALSKKTGQPILNYDVRFLRYKMFMPADSERSQVESEDGRFSYEVSEAGTWAVEIEAEGHAKFRTKPRALNKGGTLDMGDVRLGEAATIHGTVRDMQSRAVQFVRVHMLSPKMETNWDAPYTDKHGRYEIGNVSPGRYSLFAVSPRHPLGILRGVEIVEGERKQVDFTLSASTPLTVTVFDERGNPLLGAEMVWTFDAIKPINSKMVGGYEPESFGSNTSDPSGVIHKPYFPTGNVEFRIEKEGYARVERKLKLKPGEPVEMEIRLQRKG